MGWLCARCGIKYQDKDDALNCCKKEKHHDKVSKDYIKGFKHGVKWAVTMIKAKEYEILFDSKKAIQSLKEGRYKSPQTNTFNGQGGRVHSSAKLVESKVRQNKDLPSKIANTTGDTFDSWWTNNEDELIKYFNIFIEKWCGNSYSHLIDSDENDGEEFRNKIRDFKILLREQRDKEIAEFKEQIKDLKEAWDITAQQLDLTVQNHNKEIAELKDTIKFWKEKYVSKRSQR